MHTPVVFNEQVCNGCNTCVDLCPTDIFAAAPEKGKPPVVKYPDECYYCGSCWANCPRRDKGALSIQVHLAARVSILWGDPSKSMRNRPGMEDS